MRLPTEALEKAKKLNKKHKDNPNVKKQNRHIRGDSYGLGDKRTKGGKYLQKVIKQIKRNELHKNSSS